MKTESGKPNLETAFERQLERGFAGLRFQDRLEVLYRDRHALDSKSVVRVSLLAGMLFGLLLTALDYRLFPIEYFRWSIGIRMALMVPAVLLGLYFTRRPDKPVLMAVGGIIVGLTVGLGSLLLEAIGSENGVLSMFPGYIVITFYVYFLLGLLFWQALVVGFLLTGAYVALGLFSELSVLVLAYNGLFLGFSNLIGMIALYTLERTRRLNFLREGMLDYRAGHDALTGLSNRQSFDDYFERAWGASKRDKKPIAVMMIDIDHFKKYNDLYGHQAGDKCLQSVADIFGELARRPMDFAGRYGGEEFVVVLQGSTEAYAREASERLRARVEALKVPHRNSPAKVVTVSIGTAHLLPHESQRSRQGFLQLADEALYRAKERGRNCVVVSEGGDKGIQTGIFRREVGSL